MIARLPSASAISRAVECPASCVLPRTYQPSSKYAERGTAIHAFIEAARVDRAAALLAVADDETRKQCEAIDLSVIPAGAESEVALGWDPITDTAKRYTLGDKRGYPNDGLYHGTADLLGVSGRAVWVADFKTGTSHSSAADSLQMRFLALAASRLAHVEDAVVVHLTLGTDGNWHEDEHRLDGFDLDDLATALRALDGRLKADPEGAARDQRPGSWCRWCPSRPHCAAQETLVRAIVPTLADLSERVTALTSSEAGIAWERVAQAEDLIEIVKTALKDRAKREPLELPDGRLVKEVGRNVTKLDEVTAAEVLRDLGLAEKCAEYSLGHIKEVAPEAVAALERAGAVQVIQTSQVRAVGSARKRKAA